MSDFKKEYEDLQRIAVAKRTGNPRIAAFQSKLEKTMPFWPRDVESLMDDSKKGENDVEKEAIEEDLSFLRSMMTDRKASYATKDNVVSKLEEKRRKRKAMEKDAAFREKQRVDAASSSATQDQSENSEDERDCGETSQDTPKGHKSGW